MIETAKPLPSMSETQNATVGHIKIMIKFHGRGRIIDPVEGFDVAQRYVLAWPGVRITVDKEGKVEWVCFGDICPEPGTDEEGYYLCSSRYYEIPYVISVLRAHYSLDVTATV